MSENQSEAERAQALVELLDLEAVEQNLFLDGFMRHDGAGLSDEVMAEYNRPYPTAASRQILLDWPREIPMEGSPADVHAVVAGTCRVRTQI